MRLLVVTIGRVQPIKKLKTNKDMVVKDLHRMQLLDWVRDENGNFCQVVFMSIIDGLVLGLTPAETTELHYYSSVKNKKIGDEKISPLSFIKFAPIGKKILSRFNWEIVEEDQDELCFKVPGLKDVYIWSDGSYNVYNKFRNHIDEGSCRYLHEFQHVLSEHDMTFDFIPSRNPMFIDNNKN